MSKEIDIGGEIFSEEEFDEAIEKIRKFNPYMAIAIEGVAIFYDPESEANEE